MRSNLARRIANGIRRIIKKNGGKILLTIGITGMVGTTVAAVKVTPEAVERIKNRKRELGIPDDETMDIVEGLKVAAPCYIAPVITGVTSIACIIGADAINTRRNAALMTAYTLSEAAVREYKDKIVEHFGPDKASEIEHSVLEDQMRKTPMLEPEVMGNYVQKPGIVRCYDPYCGRYFWGDPNVIRKKLLELNYHMVSDMYATLNDLYYELGLDTAEKDLGWNIDHGQIELRGDSCLDSEGRPAFVMRFNVDPVYGYLDY